MQDDAKAGAQPTGDASSMRRKQTPSRHDNIGRCFIFAVLLALFLSPKPSSAQATLPPEGSSVSFALTAADGMGVTEQTYRGKWLVVYFGYTF
ncbi:MAG: SCO family protein, partial [Xanthobacteraceae bacterium]